MATISGKTIGPILLLQSFVHSDSNIRLVTLSLTIDLLKKLVYNSEEKVSYLSDHHLARIEQATEQSTEDLRRHYRVKRRFFSSRLTNLVDF